jgi:hypothetical protein
MLKQIHEIRLKDIILLDATRKTDSLKKYWFVPLWLCRGELEKLTTEIFKLIGNAIEDFQTEFDKLLSYRRLLLLETLYKAVYIEVNLRGKINADKILIGKDYEDSPQLHKVLEEVKKHTGIEIKTPENLKEFEDYVQHKIDKYQEMYPEKKKEEEVKLTKVIYSVFNYMSESYNENMRLITFIEMKAIAEERVKMSKTSGNEQVE